VAAYPADQCRLKTAAKPPPEEATLDWIPIPGNARAGQIVQFAITQPSIATCIGAYIKDGFGRESPLSQVFNIPARPNDWLD
jgi:hypothetical protein